MSIADIRNRKQPAGVEQDRLPTFRDRLVTGLASMKIQPTHWERLAVVYIRQSSPRQVLDHQESRARQYLLADYAVELGWPRERILTIDEDQGSSATNGDERFGFQRLLAEVTMDHVGMILGLEMNRLARSDKEWYHLLEVCAVFNTILADQDGVYDAADPNDRLVLGLKGTMSSLELHTMRNRLDKGRLFKAHRAELFLDLPSGYVKTPSGGIALDPDEQVREVVRLIFEKFEELGSGRAVFSYLLREGIRLGIRPHDGPNRGQLEWRRPCISTLYSMLHHPYYAGTYAYGRHAVDPKRKHSGGSRDGRRWVPIEGWKVLKQNCVPAYITWEQFLRNQAQLQRNRSSWAALGTPRQGAALLSGLLICGCCNTRMNVCYRSPKQGRYECKHAYDHGIERVCHGLAAPAIDALVTEQVLAALAPAALELSIQAGEDIQKERERQARHWKQQRERARYESRLAERRYQAVDPENRLVAHTLEQQWEHALQEERQLEEEHDRFVRRTPPTLSLAERQRIHALASDIPFLWNASATTAADRKAIVRCLIDRVVVNIQGNTECVDVTLHWAGGFISQHQIRRPVANYGQLRDFGQLVERLRELQTAGFTAAQIAAQLNREGFCSPKKHAPLNGPLVRQLLSRLGMSSERPGTVVLGPDEWWASSLRKKLDIPFATLQHWIYRGWVQYRRSPQRGFRILWADREELKRLKQLHAYGKAHVKGPFPAELTTPRPRPENRPKRKRDAGH